ncbi:hypothetical protein [Pseudomonas sp. AA-38]|uniref:hypothetical protein n=1 Tax=Pseudomonas sp. AA-38 TaxID=3028807 RepID=UPI0023F82763|nr:hypothetical protein [Pseudomonas sp. AA-38]
MRFFCLLFFALGGNPSSKKSESPEGAKPGVSENTQSGVQNTNTQTCQSGIKTDFPATPRKRKNPMPRPGIGFSRTIPAGAQAIKNDITQQQSWLAISTR